MHVVQFIEDETGAEHAFDDFEVVPLGYDRLRALEQTEAGRIKIPLHLVNARPLGTDGNPSAGKRVTIKAELETDIAVDVRALMMGGWLPPGVVPHNGVLMVDACALSVIRGRYRDGKLLERWTPDFLDLLCDRVTRVTLLPLLLEGKRRGAQSSQSDLERIYDEAAESLRRALPSAKITADKESAVQGAMGLLADSHDVQRRQRAFLRTTAPMLQARPAQDRILARWQHLVSLASDHGLRVGSMPVLASLSALVAVPGQNPAQKLIKPRPGYSDAHAHNALSDLNLLRLLLAAHADFPHDEPILLTQDRNLALFWAGLGASSSSREGDKLDCQMSPHEDLFPGDFGPRLIELASQN